MLAEPDVVGRRWVGDATVGRSWIAFGIHGRTLRHTVWCLSTELCIPAAQVQTLHLPLVSWGKLPELNFLICKIRDNDGIYCSGLFEV